MADITQIPSAKVPLTYEGDVVMTIEWYRYFYNLYGFTGNGTGVIPTNKGGTGQIIYTDGQLLIGNSTTGSLNKTTLTGNAGINIINGPGSITLSLGGSGVTPGIYGNASTVPQLTINEYGIISLATNVSIAISATQIVSGIIDPARISGNYSGITGVGTISSGVWQGTSIAVPYGGTGLSSYTLGDMLYATGTTALSKLGIGANTYILASTGTAPQWVAPSSVSIGIATNLAGGSANQIPYQTGASTTSFITAPTIADTYLNWSGSAFRWSSNPLGTVTSVSGTGTVNGITLTGTVTSSGSLTLGGTLSGIGNSQLTNSTISGVALGGSLFSLTAGTGVSFSAGTTYNGSAAITITATGSGGTVTSVTGTSPVVSSGGTTPAISMPVATTSVSGYLSSTDWTTFNNKSNTNGTVTSVAALTLGTTGTDLSSTVATGTTTPVITLQVPTASATNRGALSSTDWSTFNNKQATLVSGTNIKTVNSTSLLGSGDVAVGVLTVTGTAPVVSSGGANPAISMAAATSTVNGYLTSTDWTTFNNKGSGTVTSVTGTAPVVSSGGTTPAISMAAATTSVNGYLTSTDWNTFNGKAPGVTFTSTYIPYGQGTTTLNQSSTFTYDGTTLTVPSASHSGNITFTGTGNRITGLMDGATIANILAFQTSTTNAGTRLNIISNGTGTASSLDIYGISNPTNAASLRLRTSGVDTSIRSDITGTGTYLPLTFYTNGSERARIFTSGGVSIGNTTDPGATNLSVSGTINTGGYTVATLPTGVTGARVYVTNALAPTFGATVVGGGAVTIPVFYNGTNWIVG